MDDVWTILVWFEMLRKTRFALEAYKVTWRLHLIG